MKDKARQLKPVRSEGSQRFCARERALLFLAQGFGSGRLPLMPGTFGSVVGLAWFFLLVQVRPLSITFVLAMGSVALSILTSQRAEELLGQKDPGSIVIDEIIAVPFCFFYWVVRHVSKAGSLQWTDFCADGRWVVLLLGFLFFRFFDALKPWPINLSQRLPGGWGITIDDLLAAAYVNVALWVSSLCLPWINVRI